MDSGKEGSGEERKRGVGAGVYPKTGLSQRAESRLLNTPETHNLSFFFFLFFWGGVNSLFSNQRNVRVVELNFKPNDVWTRHIKEIKWMKDIKGRVTPLRILKKVRSFQQTKLSGLHKVRGV